MATLNASTRGRVKFLQARTGGFSSFLLDGCSASEARQAEGEAARGQLGWEKGHVVKPGVLQACPHDPPDPPVAHPPAQARS